MLLLAMFVLLLVLLLVSVVVGDVCPVACAAVGALCEMFVEHVAYTAN